MNYKKLIKSTFPWIGSTNVESIREEWIKNILLNQPSGSRILDAGAGTQKNKLYCSHLEYVSQDFAAYNGVGDEKGLQTGSFNYGDLDIISDITSIPEKNQSFDIIMCIEVLEHLPDPLLAIKEFSRLLKPEGTLILTAPFCSLTHYAPYHFCTGFNKYWYEKNLVDNDFNLLQILPIGNFFNFLSQEIYRLITVSKKYTKIKRLNLLDYISIFYMQKRLSNLSRIDNGSSELLCDSYAVLASKRK